MNSREQILAKRVAALEARLQASMVVIDHLIRDLEFTESVGAAFAFDYAEMSNYLMSKYESVGMPERKIAVDSLMLDMRDSWGAAVKALESAREAAQEESGE